MAFRHVVGGGIFANNGSAWMESRRMLRPYFASPEMADLKLVERHVGNLLQTLRPLAGSQINLRDYFVRMMTDISTEIILGHSTRCLSVMSTDKDYVDSSASITEPDRFLQAMEDGSAGCQRILALGYIAMLLGTSRFRRARKYLHRFVDQQVQNVLKEQEAATTLLNGDKNGESRTDARLNHDGRPRSFLQYLATQTVNPQRLRSESLGLIFASRDSSGNLVAHLFYQLARSPSAWEKLKREVDTLGGEKPTHEQLKTLTYLRSCIDEALRLQPVVPLTTRVALRDTFLPIGGGVDGSSPIFVERGAVVHYSAYHLHRREDLWGRDAHEFRPERWGAGPEEVSQKKKGGWDYVPFLGGPRLCLGNHLAIITAAYITVRMLQEFRHIECRDYGPWIEQYALSLSNTTGTQVVLTP